VVGDAANRIARWGTARKQQPMIEQVHDLVARQAHLIEDMTIRTIASKNLCMPKTSSGLI
jgi:hypothetical protein